MNSEGHRNNILNPYFTGIVVGAAKTAEGDFYYSEYLPTYGWVQLFVY